MTIDLLQGDCRTVLATLPANSVHCCVTSPPYFGLRDYGTATWVGGTPFPPCDHRRSVWDGPKQTQGAQSGHAAKGDRLGRRHCITCGATREDRQIGMEETLDAYVTELVSVFREVRRVLRDDATLWLNLGDSYNAAGRSGHGTRVGYKQGTNRASADGSDACRSNDATVKPKDLLMVPARVALALQADGWWLRSDIIWAKPNPMPESVTDRPTSSFEHVFLLAKAERYFFDAEAVREEATVRSWDDGSRTFGGVNKHGANLLHGERTTGRLTTPSKRTIKVPGGWDRGEGAHGTIHRDGRTSAEYQEAYVRSGRNLRNVWTIATAPFAEAHFATFPPALVERCIKAGTSGRGCCPACGAPWSRVIKRTGHINRREPAHCANNTPTKTDSTGWAPVSRGTNEWHQTCKCPAAEPVPCTVLDPFSGAGTTAMVAQQLGRSAIGIELNPEYIEMAWSRIQAKRPHERIKPTADAPDHAGPLFAAAGI